MYTGEVLRESALPLEAVRAVAARVRCSACGASPPSTASVGTEPLPTGMLILKPVGTGMRILKPLGGELAAGTATGSAAGPRLTEYSVKSSRPHVRGLLRVHRCGDARSAAPMLVAMVERPRGT